MDKGSVTIIKAPRQRLNPLKRRELILEDALQLFTERHYSGVTVRDIALRCGINVGLIYHYFDSKEHLFRCALEFAIDELVSGFEARRRPGDDALAVILAWLDVHATLTPTATHMVKLMTDYAASGPRDPAFEAEMSRFYDFERDLLEEALRRGMAAGAFRPLDAAKMARLIGLHLDGIFHGSQSRGDHRVAEDIDDFALALRALILPR